MKKLFAKGMALFSILLMDMLMGMEFDLFTPAFPDLQRQFELSPFWVEALLSINFTGFCLSLFFVGGLADRYGRKPIIVLGIIIFILGSSVCLSAESYILLLIGRFLQGIGIAAPGILSFLIIADAYSFKKQQQIMAIMNGIMNISVAASPVIGSYITMHFQWQGNFIALLLLALITLLMTMFFVPKGKLPKHKEAISLCSYLPIFRSRHIMLLILHLTIMCVPYWVFVGMSPILYMEDLGVSLTHFGYYQGAAALVFALGSVFSGLIINKYDQKKLLGFSSILYLISLITIALATILNSQNPLFITLAFIPFTIAQAIPCTILFPLFLNLLPKAKGRMSAVFRGIHLILSALSLQLAGYIYRGTFQNIGFIIIFFIVMTIVTMLLVIRNHKLMKFLQKK